MEKKVKDVRIGGVGNTVPVQPKPAASGASGGEAAALQQQKKLEQMLAELK